MWNLSHNIILSLDPKNLDFISNISMLILFALAILFLIKFIKAYKYKDKPLEASKYMVVIVFLALLILSFFVPYSIVYGGNFVSVANTIVIMLYIPSFIFSVFLMLSNVILIIKNGYCKKNTMNFLFVFLIISSEYLLYKVALAEDTITLVIFSEIIGAVCLYFLLVFIGNVITLAVFHMFKPRYDKDFIIILGCRCTHDNRPSDLMVKRLDTALKFYHKQLEITGRKATFLVTGGHKGTQSNRSEADIMKRYLMEHDIAEDDIILENKAINTYQNMKFCKKIIEKINKNSKSVFVTNGFHIFRSSVFADMNNLNACGISSKSEKWYFSVGSFIMEYKGVFDKYKKQNLRIFILAFIISVFVGYVLYFLHIFKN